MNESLRSITHIVAARLLVGGFASKLELEWLLILDSFVLLEI